MNKHQVTITDSYTIGKDAPTALNVLVGANCYDQINKELEKVATILDNNFPVSIITDLSLVEVPVEKAIWSTVANDGRCIAGTVPIYQVVSGKKTIEKNKLLDLIQLQAENGVKIITIHPTPSVKLIDSCKERLVPITSRGGAIVCFDMINSHRDDNVYIQSIDDILKIAKKNAVVLSIGSSFRSANINDALDSTYFMELKRQLEIADYCMKHNVNAIIETPGHVSPQGIFKLCDYLNESCPYPIMPLGPIPTDCAFEYDDFAASIGSVLMGTRGCADVLSVVTRDEHLGGIPSVQSIIEAIKKYSVAKHIIDIYKINDITSDYQTALKRSERNSCIMDGRICSRCADVCPLKMNCKKMKNHI